jgi:PilZ domain-containing protein
MIYGFDASDRADSDEIASLTTEVRVRVLNVSAVGCLVETNRALEIGSAGTLRLVFSGGDFEDTVQIVRCQEITGGGSVYHVGLTFLTTTPPSIESLRYLIRRESRSWTGWIRMRATH